ncbi:MAG: VCBS repeat-containing protein [Planctomycetes bacterium]|nr:VCBS repeat-containing protein [Planctomycetota bacterium]
MRIGLIAHLRCDLLLLVTVACAFGANTPAAAQEGPPIIDGSLAPFEWRSNPRLFETGPRPPLSTGWQRLGLRAWIGHDQSQLYVALQSYPVNGAVDGPFGTLYLELHGTTPPRFLAQLHDNLSGSWPGIGTPWPAGTAMLRGGVVTPTTSESFEARIPFAALGLDPWTEAYEVHLRVDAPGGGGYDTLLSAGAGYSFAPTPAGSGRSLVAPSSARFLGRTKPRFFPSASLPSTAGRGLSAVIATDLDGDALREIVAAFAATGELDVQESLGGSSFALLNRVSGLGRVSDLASADIDGDGFDDVVAVEEGAAVHVLLGDGLGALAPPLTLPFPMAARVLPFAYDADSDLDLAVATRNGPLFDGALWVLRNDGAGVFTPIAWPGALGTPEALAAGDVDGDARPDLLVADLGSAFQPQGLWLYRNLPIPSRSALPGVAFPSAVAIDDFDGDTRNDALAISGASVLGPRDLYFAAGQIGGGLGAFSPLGLGAALPWDFAFGDLGGDRVPDLFLLQLVEQPLRVLTDFDGASFAAQKSFDATPATTLFAVGDFQGDGFEDLIFANLAADELMIRYAGEAPRADVYGTACPGTPGTPIIGASGSAELGGSFTFTLANAPAVALCELYVAFAPWDVPIGGGCSLYFDLGLFVAALQITSPLGTASLTAPIPYEPLLVGADSFGQWVIADPGGALLGIASLSAGLRVRLGLADG